MARATKRTSVLLGTLACVFVIIIIVLCIVPRGDSPIGSPKHGGPIVPDVITDTITTTSTPAATPTPKTTPGDTTATATPQPVSSTTPEPTTPKPTSPPATTPKPTSPPTTTPKPTSPPATTPKLTSPPTTTPKPTSPSATTPKPTSPTTTPKPTSPPATTPIPLENTTAESTTSETPSPFTTTAEPTSPPTTTTKPLENTTAESTTSETPSPSTTTTKPLDNTTAESTTSETPSPSTTTTKPLENTTAESTTSETPSPSTTTTKPLDNTTAESTTSETPSPSTTTAEPTSPPTTTADSTTASSTTAPSAPTSTGNTTHPEQETCDSAQCKTVAANMLAMMDHGATDRCQNFYQYACGGLMRNPYLEGQDRSVISKGLIKDGLAETGPNTTTSVGNMRVFYDSCLDAVNQEPTDGWSQTVQKVFGTLQFNQTPAMNLTDTLTYMMQHGFAPFFDVNVDVDQEDNSMFNLNLHPAVPGSLFSEDLASKVCLEEHLQRLEELEEGTKSYDVQEEYKTYSVCVLKGDGLEARLERMEEAVRRFGLLDQLNDPDQTLQDIKNNAKKLLQELADVLPSIPELKQKLVNKNFIVKTFDELRDEVGVIDWKKLIDQLAPDAAPDSMQVYMEGSITEILSVLQDHYNRNETALTDVLLMLWSEKLYTDFVNPLGSSVGDEEYCLNAAITLMPDAASQLYMDKLGNTEIDARKAQVTSIAQSIRRAGKKELEKDDEINKLTEMLDEIKTPDTTAAEEELQLGSDFFDNCIQLLENRRNLANSQYDKNPIDTLSAFMQPYYSFGVHVYLLNRILIPFGAQEDSSTFNNVPEYLSYAGIGHMISHLVMHGYDTSGVQYQSNGQHKLERQADFTRRMTGLRTQYTEEKSFSSPDGVTVNTTMSELALNELLADSGATRLAWEAYIMRNDIDPTTATLHGSFVGNTARRRRRSAGDSLPTLDTVEPPLPWLGLTPAQLYFLHWTQQYCSATGGMSLLELTESVQPPARMRVNLVLQNEPLFNKAFQCTPKPPVTPFTLG